MSWKTKRLQKFTIKIHPFFFIPEALIKPIIGGTTEISCFAQGFSINGFYNPAESELLVDSIKEQGMEKEVFHKSFLLALEESTGDFEAILLHKDGLSATKLTVSDGVVTETKVDI